MSVLHNVSGFVRARRHVVVLLLGYALLLGAWIFGNPPGSSPDEPAHYIKALGVAGTDWDGDPPDATRRESEAKARGVDAVRVFHVKASLFSDKFGCTSFAPTVPATCLHGFAPVEGGSSEEVKLESAAGTYQPFMYLPAGVAAGLADGPAAGMWTGRIAQASLNLLLIALAAGALWDRSRPATIVLGLGLAITPMTLFLASSINPSGTEILGGICLGAGIIGVARPQENGGWLALGAGACALTLSRPTGPLWLLTFAATAVLALRPRRAWDLLRNQPARSSIAMGAVFLSFTAALAWELVHQTPPTTRNVREFASFSSAFAEFPGFIEQYVGVFGAVDTHMPFLGYAAWLGCVLMVSLLAWLVATKGQRRAFLLLWFAVPLAIAAFSALWLRPWDLGRQGRYFMPIAVAIPLCAAELIRRNPFRLGAAWPRNLPALVTAVVAVVHWLAWYSNSRRHAVGTDGPIIFLNSAKWAPPLGWMAWTVVATIGTLAIAWFGFASNRAQMPSDDAGAL